MSKLTPFDRMMLSIPEFSQHSYSYACGLISKDRAAEWLVAQNTGGKYHHDRSHPGSDVVVYVGRKRTLIEVKFATVYDDISQASFAPSCTINNLASKEKNTDLIVYVDCPDQDKVFVIDIPYRYWSSRVSGVGRGKGSIKLTMGKHLGTNKNKSTTWFDNYITEITWWKTDKLAA